MFYSFLSLSRPFRHLFLPCFPGFSFFLLILILIYFVLFFIFCFDWLPIIKGVERRENNYIAMAPPTMRRLWQNCSTRMYSHNFLFIQFSRSCFFWFGDLTLALIASRKDATHTHTHNRSMSLMHKGQQFFCFCVVVRSPAGPLFHLALIFWKTNFFPQIFLWLFQKNCAYLFPASLSLGFCLSVFFFSMWWYVMHQKKYLLL